MFLLFRSPLYLEKFSEMLWMGRQVLSLLEIIHQVKKVSFVCENVILKNFLLHQFFFRSKRLKSTWTTSRENTVRKNPQKMRFYFGAKETLEDTKMWKLG